MSRSTFTDEERWIFTQRVLAHVATLNPDGSPQVSAMWVELDGDDILLNTEEGRVKPRNMRNDPRIAISVVDPANETHNISVQGKIVEITHDGADEMIDRLSRKYLGHDYIWRVPDKQRIKVRVRPEQIGGSTR